jgi:hypothetical protein
VGDVAHLEVSTRSFTLFQGSQALLINLLIRHETQFLPNRKHNVSPLQRLTAIKIISIQIDNNMRYINNGQNKEYLNIKANGGDTWVRYCATSQKVAGSITHEVTGFFT